MSDLPCEDQIKRCMNELQRTVDERLGPKFERIHGDLAVLKDTAHVNAERIADIQGTLRAVLDVDTADMRTMTAAAIRLGKLADDNERRNRIERGLKGFVWGGIGTFLMGAGTWLLHKVADAIGWLR